MNQIEVEGDGTGRADLCTSTGSEPLLLNEQIDLVNGNFTDVTIGCLGQSSSTSPVCAISVDSGFFQVQEVTFQFENIIVSEEMTAMTRNPFLNTTVMSEAITVSNCEFLNFVRSVATGFGTGAFVISVANMANTLITIHNSTFENIDGSALEILSTAPNPDISHLEISRSTFEGDIHL